GGGASRAVEPPLIVVPVVVRQPGRQLVVARKLGLIHALTAEQPLVLAAGQGDGIRAVDVLDWKRAPRHPTQAARIDRRAHSRSKAIEVELVVPDQIGGVEGAGESTA